MDIADIGRLGRGWRLNRLYTASWLALLAALPANAATITTPLQPVPYSVERRCCPTRTEMLGRHHKRCGFRHDRGGAGGAIGGRTDDFQVTGSLTSGGALEAISGHPGGNAAGGIGGVPGGSSSLEFDMAVDRSISSPTAAVPGPIVGSGIIGIILLVLLTLANYWNRMHKSAGGYINGEDNGTSKHQRRV